MYAPTHKYALGYHSAEPTAVVQARSALLEGGSVVAQALPRVRAAVAEQGLTPAGQPFTYFYAAPDGPVVEAGVPVDGPFLRHGAVSPGALPATRVVYGMHTGPYERLDETYVALAMWAIGHGLEPTGDAWEVYVGDAEQEPSPADNRTAVYLAVE
jgi:effector-binding domain-containing protein